MQGVQARRLIAVMLVTMALGGCGSTVSPQSAARSSGAMATVTPTPTPPATAGVPGQIGGARIVVHSATVEVAANQAATATARCAPGETLFGGGESASYFEEVAVSSNYPSAPNAWTASAGSAASSLSLEVDAYCLKAPAIAVTIVSATGSRVNCPAGYFVLGGGYSNTSYGAGYSLPEATGEGWQIQGGSSAEVYALCARAGLHMQSLVRSTFTLPTGIGNSDDGQASCPAGQFASGGGFSGGNVADQGAAPDFTAYVIEVFSTQELQPSNEPTETVVSLCATV